MGRTGPINATSKDDGRGKVIYLTFIVVQKSWEKPKYHDLGTFLFWTLLLFKWNNSVPRKGLGKQRVWILMWDTFFGTCAQLRVQLRVRRNRLARWEETHSEGVGERCAYTLAPQPSGSATSLTAIALSYFQLFPGSCCESIFLKSIWSNGLYCKLSKLLDF